MTRSAAKRANASARAVYRAIGDKACIQWQDKSGEAFSDVSARVFAQSLNVPCEETHWAYAAELMNAARWVRP